MELTYRLEYSEEQQWLRMDNRTHAEMSNGFMVIKDNCTVEECNLIECFLYRNEQHGPLTDNKKYQYSTVDVLRAVNELNDFRKHLDKYKYQIIKSN